MKRLSLIPGLIILLCSLGCGANLFGEDDDATAPPPAAPGTPAPPPAAPGQAMERMPLYVTCDSDGDGVREPDCIAAMPREQFEGSGENAHEYHVELVNPGSGRVENIILHEVYASPEGVIVDRATNRPVFADTLELGSGYHPATRRHPAFTCVANSADDCVDFEAPSASESAGVWTALEAVRGLGEAAYWHADDAHKRIDRFRSAPAAPTTAPAPPPATADVDDGYYADTDTGLIDLDAETPAEMRARHRAERRTARAGR